MILSIIAMSGVVHIRSSTVPFVLAFSFHHWIGYVCMLKCIHGIVVIIISICYNNTLVHHHGAICNVSQLQLQLEKRFTV